VPPRFAYACFVRAEQLLSSSPGPQLDTVAKTRRESEAHLGSEAGSVRKNLDATLAQAKSLLTSEIVAR